MEKEINKFHALQLFTDTFAAETVHLNNSKIGIYIRLLCFAWTKNTKAFTTESAYRICYCKDDDCKIEVDEVLKEFFILDFDQENDKEQWTHKRLVEEHQYLTTKYKKKSEAGKKGMKIRYDSVNNKTVTPIPNPIPKPNNIYDENFEVLWKSLNKKRGSKYKSYQLWQKLDIDMPEIEQTVKIYNNQIDKIEDDKFVPHFSTWLSQRRWEIEENNALPNIVDRMKKLGYLHKGREDNYEKFAKDGKNYKIDIYDTKHQLIIEH